MSSRDWTILCDFDGTITLDDVTDRLLARLGSPGWERLENDWRRGLIGSRECMAGQVALLDGTRDALDAVIDDIGIDPEFPRFLELARGAGVSLTIVSDGLDYAIERVLARYRICALPVVANRLVQKASRRWAIEFPHADAQCRSGNCKCTCVSQAHTRHAALLIGDGQSDVCVAGRADFVFAKHRLLEHCREAGVPHRAISGFAEACALLPQLLAGELAAPVRPLSIPSTRVQYA